MICQNAILSDEYMDYIWKADVNPPAEMDPLPYGVCAQYISPSFSVYYISRKEVFGNRTSLPIGDYALPWCYTQLNTESLETTKILQVQNQPTLKLRGQGVILGFLDSGIELKQMTFRKADGKTRVLELWDQTDQSGRSPEGFQYGSVYTSEDIDKLLAEEQEVLPGKDENGHGTKVASIAASSELLEENYLGAAPEAELAVVKLKQAKPFIRQMQRIPLDSIAYEEADIMLAVRYLDQLAQREGKPLVICMALGSNTGGHTGENALSLYLNYVCRKVGRAVVVAAGNEGNKGHHYFGIVPRDQDYTEVELRVGAEEKGFQVNLWGNAPDLFSVEVIAPSGEKIPRFVARKLDRQRYDFVFESTILDIQYELSEIVSGDQRLLLAFQNPTPGIWMIRVYAEGNLENTFHMWLPVTGFISDETYFLRPDPDTTVTEPGNAEGVLTFSGYDARNGSIWYDSGRGYTRNGRIKPDLAAPAVEVAAVGLRGRVTTLTGSSAAAALGAGACALLLEWGIVRGNVPAMDSITIQRYLIRGANRLNIFDYPNKTWGYGSLDLYDAFRSV